MRKRWIQDQSGKLIPAEEYQAPLNAGFFVVPDIQPYQSMITGEMIGGRAQHRAHLRQHNCIEVGNELDKPKPQPKREDPRLKRQLIEAANHFLRER
jgi:hypothetical protein